MESTLNPHKKPKLNQQNDRLSNLPEPILTHILSFLNTTQVIQTSILSNTWKPLWKTLTSFDFDYTILNDLYHDNFLATAREVLETCQPPELHYFCLCYDFRPKFLSSDVIKLFDVLARYRVQCLDLKQSVGKCLSCIPTLEYLVAFKLDMCLNQLHSFHIPSSMWLPSLESVHFRSVVFIDGTDFIETFLSKCPVLSKLIITDCGIGSVEHVTISSKLLRHLEIHSIYVYRYGYHIAKVPCTITVCTPNLVSFKCRSNISNKYCLENLSALNDAEIDMKPYNMSQLTMEQKGKFGPEMVKLLGGLCNAESLMVSGLFITVIAQDIEVFTTPFRALRHLKMRTWLTRDTIKVIRCLLHHCDNVETLSLEVITLEVDLGIKRPVFFADWKFSNLRVLKIKGIQGFEEEVDFLKGVLKSATNLEELIVFKRKDSLAGSEKRLEEMRDTLLAFPRESSSIKIQLC